MAVLCADTKTPNLCARTLAQCKLPVENRLAFPVVALPGVGHMPAAGEDEKDAARVFYVGATRARQRLVMGGGWGREICKEISVLTSSRL